MSAMAPIAGPAGARSLRCGSRERLVRLALDLCCALALGPWFVVNAATLAGTASAIDAISPQVTLFAMPLVALSIGLVRLHLALSAPGNEAPRRFAPAMVLLASACLVVSVVGGFASSRDHDGRAIHTQLLKVAK